MFCANSAIIAPTWTHSSEVAAGEEIPLSTITESGRGNYQEAT